MALIIASPIWRSRRLKNLPLRPNCLLTRHPVVFVPGEKSLFYFASYWNKTPDYLYEHGYLVEEWALSWRGHQRQTELKEKLTGLSHLGRKAHLILPHQGEFEPVLKECSDALASNPLASVTYIDEVNTSESLNTQTFNLVLPPKPSQNLLGGLIFLIHCPLFFFHNIVVSRKTNFHKLNLDLNYLISNQDLWLNHFIMLAEKDYIDSDNK